MIAKRSSNNLTSQIVVSAIIIASLVAVWFTIDVFLLAFAGVLIAVFLRSINALVKKLFSISDGLSMAITLSLVLLSLILIVLIIVPVVSEQAAKLTEEIQNAWQKLTDFLGTYLNLQPLLSINQKVDVKELFQLRNGILGSAANIVTTTFGFFGSIFVAAFIGIFVAFEPATYQQHLVSLIPPNKKSEVYEILMAATETLRFWLIGAILSMALVGISTALGLWLIGIELSFILGLLAAILTFIPNIGPVISIIPAVLIAIIQSPMLAIYVIILYVAIQIVESYIITPLIMKKSISVPPALLICFQLMMAILLGGMGLILAAPILVVVREIIKKSYLKNNA